MAKGNSRAKEFASKAAKIGAILGAAMLVTMAIASPPVWVTLAGTFVAFTLPQMIVFCTGMGILGAALGATAFGIAGSIAGMFFHKKEKYMDAPMQGADTAPAQDPQLAQGMTPQLAQAQTQAQNQPPSQEPSSTYFQDSVINSRQAAAGQQR